MVDFKLTEYGDLVLMEQTETPSLILLTFYITPNPSIKLDFNFYKKDTFKSNLPFKLDFIIGDGDCSVSEKLIHGEEALKQLIYTTLQTSKTERSYDLEYGSRLEEMLYQNYKNQSYLNSVTTLVRQAIDQLNVLRDYQVVVKPNVQASIDQHTPILNIYIITHDGTLNIEWEVQ